MNAIHHLIRPAFVLGLLALMQGSQAASPVQVVFSEGRTFVERDGEAIYRNVCQACHMPDGKGAEGAGLYPSLAGNAKLGARAYVAHMVVNGARAMPGFGGMMDDEQVAAVVNYLRTHFGNGFEDVITAAEVQTLRQAP
jgi:mono/diheme cytochrome c family protein